MVLIGLLGNARSGKSTFSEYLQNNYNFIEYAFAEPLKQAAKIIFDLNDEQLYGNLKEQVDKRWGLSPREMFQKLGTECCRNQIDPEIWVKRMEIWYRKNNDKNIVFSDVRFENEAKMIKKLGGIIIKINRKKKENIKEHISEQYVNKINYDILINNNDDLNIYYKNIENIITNILKSF